MTIPHDHQYQPIQHILLIFESRRMKGLVNYLNTLVLYAKAFESTIHIIHVSRHSRDGEAYQAEASQALQKARFDSERMQFRSIQEQALGSHLPGYLKEMDIQLVALPEPQLHLLEGIYSEHLFEGFCCQTGLPVLGLNLHHQN